MKRNQRNMEVSSPSYLDRISHGRRSPYIRVIVDRHLDELEVAVLRLMSGHSADQIREYVAEADMPRRVATDLDFLSAIDREDIFALAEEVDLTGIDALDLIKVIVGKDRLRS